MIAALQELVKKWRRQSIECYGKGYRQACGDCADELSAMLASHPALTSELPNAGGQIRIEERNNHFEVHQDCRIQRNVHLGTFTTREAAEAFIRQHAACQPTSATAKEGG